MSAWGKGRPQFKPDTETKTKTTQSTQPTQSTQTTQLTQSGHFDFAKDSFKAASEFFYKNGYVIIDNALSETQIANLKNELISLQTQPTKNKDATRHEMFKCFFEKSNTTVDIIESSKLSDFASYVIADVPDSRPGNSSLKAHVIHSNAFSVPPGGRGQAPSWHVDDPCQQVIIPYGYELPEHIRLPVLVCTYMIWLSDCETPDCGPTWVVPESHRWGQQVDPVYADQHGIPACGKAGTAVLVNANLWHRGCANTSSKPRHTLQITWARRIIGHKFKTIMNYMMPAHVTAGRSELLKERLGWLQGGAYS